MESQPQNTEFRNNPENFHPWASGHIQVKIVTLTLEVGGSDLKVCAHLNFMPCYG